MKRTVDPSETKRCSSHSRRGFLKALFFGAGGCIAASSGFSARSEPPPSTGRVLSELGRGGCVVYVRHAQTDRSRDDVLQPDLKNCATQRLLSAAGEKQADELGMALRALSIPVGEIFCSPYCRTLETARRAFPGHATIEVPDLGRLGRTITKRIPESCARLKQLLATKPAAGQNTFIVGHSDNLAAVGGPEIDEAGFAIFRPEKDGFKLIGTLNPPEWRRAAARQREQGAASTER